MTTTTTTTAILRSQWRNLINTYGQTAGSTASARLKGAANAANAACSPSTAIWYAVAITAFWN